VTKKWTRWEKVGIVGLAWIALSVIAAAPIVLPIVVVLIVLAVVQGVTGWRAGWRPSRAR
jgi:hypothetical protein